MASAAAAPAGPIETDVPARLDRLPWARWHWLIVVALGVSWVLDGLEVTIVGAIGAVLEKSDTLGLSVAEVGFAGSAYLAGAISGALLFGYLADRLGRKRLFMITLGLYLTAAVLTALSWDFWSFMAFRFLTGTAIGGEYSAINSAINELIPSRVRGRVNLAINGSYWLGAAAGAAASIILLDPALIAEQLGWRLCFGLGVLLGGAILFARRNVPESPRWLITHGRADEAETIVAKVESDIARRYGDDALTPTSQKIAIHTDVRIGIGQILHTLFVTYRSRAVLGLVLMAAQAFFYNAIFFTYALVLNRFYEVESARVGLYLLPFAAGNFLGPIVLGPLFDSLGRKRMISGTYGLSAVMLVATGLLFVAGRLDAVTQTLCWSLVFFVASPAASAAYLTVSEVFPIEMRALAIAVFYAAGTALGGLAAPALFGLLIQSGQPIEVFYGYLVGAGLMLVAAMVELRIGVAAARRSLEEVAAPMTAAASDA